MTQRLQRVGNRRGMMTEIVNHLYAARFAAKLLPSRDPGKTLERAVDFCLRHIVKPRRHRGHRGVAHVEFANQRNFENVVAKFKSRTAG